MRMLAGSLFLLIPLGSCAAPVSDTPEPAFERYRTKINLHRIEALETDVIGRDPLYIFAWEVHRGIDQIRTFFTRRWLVLPDEVYAMTSAEWLAWNSTTGWVTFRYSHKSTMLDEHLPLGKGRSTNLFRRT